MNSVKIQCFVSRSLPGVVAAVSVAVAGCLMQPSYSAKVTTADGALIEVPLSTGRMDIRDDEISVKVFQFLPWTIEKDKGLAYAFQLEFKAGSKPVAVSVDDVSDTPILSIYTDNAPVLHKNNIWAGISPPHRATEDTVKWILNMDNTVKVYRFTVKLADGTTHVLRYPIFAPAYMKAFMRGQLGVTL